MVNALLLRKWSKPSNLGQEMHQTEQVEGKTGKKLTKERIIFSQFLLGNIPDCFDYINQNIVFL